MDSPDTKATPAPDELLVVGCGKAKVWHRQPTLGPVAACDAYCSSLFKLCRRYAESRGTPWVILSAKYGLLDPGTAITDYNVAFGQHGKTVTTEELGRQWRERFEHVRRVISLASKAYDARLAAAFPEGVKLETPLKGMGLFQRTAWLAKQRASVSNRGASVP